MSTQQELRDRRRIRLRYQLRRKAGGRPRLSVFRSGKNIYAQVIDDAAGRTVAAASSLDRDLRERLKSGADSDAAVTSPLMSTTAVRPSARRILIRVGDSSI